MRSLARPLRAAAVGALALYCLDGVVRKYWLRGRPQVLHSVADDRMRRILERVPALRGRYLPPPWAHSAYPQMAVLLLWRFLRRGAVRLETHTIRAPDGGTVAVREMLPPPGRQPLPADAPVMLILHTITGVAEDETEFMLQAFERGFRAAVLSRRGHGAALETPKFNVMGCTDDTTLMVDFVRERYPEAFIGAVGVSAGSGQVVSYIGRQEGPGPVHAAVSLCPAYDIASAFRNFDERSPALARYVLDGLKRFFLQRNEPVLRESRGFAECMSASTVHGFMEGAVHMAGHNSLEDYLEHSNPMARYDRNQIPCLVLNALDDPLCVEANIRKDIAAESPNYALVLTDAGSHVAYREGLLGQTSYMHRLALDFLDAARHELGHT